MTTGFRTKITNVRLKDGKLIPTNKHKDASARIRERTSKKVRVVKRTKA